MLARVNTLFSGFALVCLFGYAFLQAGVKAKTADFATNLAALVIFVLAGAVLWKFGLRLSRWSRTRHNRAGHHFT